jgi:TPR repeat protein
MKLLLISLVLLTGCATSKSDYAKLTVDELKEAIASADAGDGRAALSVADHYQFGEHDYKKGDFWCRRAADLGALQGCACIDTSKEAKPKSCE